MTTREAAIEAANQEFRALLDRCHYLVAEEVVDAAAEIYPRHLTGGEEAAQQQSGKWSCEVSSATVPSSGPVQPVQATGPNEVQLKPGWLKKQGEETQAEVATWPDFWKQPVQASGEGGRELRTTVGRLDELYAAACAAEFRSRMNPAFRQFAELAYDQWPAISAALKQKLPPTLSPEEELPLVAPRWIDGSPNCAGLWLVLFPSGDKSVWHVELVCDDESEEPPYLRFNDGETNEPVAGYPWPPRGSFGPIPGPEDAAHIRAVAQRESTEHA